MDMQTNNLSITIPGSKPKKSSPKLTDLEKRRLVEMRANNPNDLNRKSVQRWVVILVARALRVVAGTQGSCTVSRPYLQQLTRCSKPAIRRAIDFMEANKWIRAQHRGKERKPSTYRFTSDFPISPDYFATHQRSFALEISTKWKGPLKSRDVTLLWHIAHLAKRDRWANVSNASVREVGHTGLLQ